MIILICDMNGEKIKQKIKLERLFTWQAIQLHLL
jgi:hypothetical protein